MKRTADKSQVAEAWRHSRLGTLMRFVNGKAISIYGDDGQYPVYGSNGVIGSADTRNCGPGTIVIGRVGSCGALRYVPSSAWVTDNAMRATPRGSNFPRFLFYLLQSLSLGDRHEGSAQPLLNQNTISSTPVIVPDVSYQTAIARFLDHMDRRIQKYIRAKEKLIALLDEYKQALIHQAVTGQVDVRTGKPYAEYKESEVKWIGRIPRHWRVSRVKTEFSCLNHRRIPLSSTERGEMISRQFDYYGASGVIDKVDDYLFDDELLLLAEDGANLVLRNLPLAIIAKGKFWVNNHAHILKPKKGRLEYLAAVLEGLDFAPCISGAAQPKLTQDRLLGVVIAVPDSKEQDRVVAFMESETSDVCKLVDRARREISLLREYRTRLIADVVTGKIDVREAAASLPEIDGIGGDDASNSLNQMDAVDLDEATAVA